MRAEDIHQRLVYYTPSEELFNRLTHGVAALLSAAGLLLLVLATADGGDPWRIVSCTIYGSSLTLFYLFSTIYHSVQQPHLKYLFRILDHAGIYLLIAGTYTPITLVNLRGPWGWSMFGAVWGLAIVGAIFKTFLTHRLRLLGPVFYLALGWMAIIGIQPMLANIAMAGIWWIVAGGLAYSFGLIFYAWDGLPYNHTIWHLFVMAGSGCHFLAVLWYVVPL